MNMSARHCSCAAKTCFFKYILLSYSVPCYVWNRVGANLNSVHKLSYQQTHLISFKEAHKVPHPSLGRNTRKRDVCCAGFTQMVTGGYDISSICYPEVSLL